MRKIISLTLAALMLVTLLLTATSCELSMEAMTGYTQLRDYVTEKADENGEIPLDASQVGSFTVKLSAPIKKGEDKPEAVYLIVEDGNQDYPERLVLTMTGSAEKAHLSYESVDAEGTKVAAKATVLLTHYTGNDLVEFTSVTNIQPDSEQDYRDSVTSLLNSALKVLDIYTTDNTTDNLGLDLHELGFIVLSDKYMAPVTETVTEEDLGGALSAERLGLAGRMILQGVGMVFLVLAILWLVLLVFKKVFYKDPAKATKKEAEPVPSPVASAVEPAPVPVVAADDGALIAAITAAVSAYIESDPALTSQFAGGFRVVSFKPTTKSRNR